MARKRGSKDKVSKTTGSDDAALPQEGATLTVVPAYPNPFPSFYANYASVSHSPSEVFIDCALVAMPYNVSLEDSQVLAPVIARIILPPPVAQGLITALQAQTEKQKTTIKSGTLAVSLPKPKKDQSA
jgi:Protein of unknown function (DUF3467)